VYERGYMISSSSQVPIRSLDMVQTQSESSMSATLHYRAIQYRTLSDF
jgi:hypothetical protein